MATYDSTSTEKPGQYPTTAFHLFGLPEQNFGSGAAGGSPPSSNIDQGNTNEPGQYPDRDDFTGVTFSLGGVSGSGAPGTTGVAYPPKGGGKGSDSVTYSKTSFYKGERDAEDASQANGTGYLQRVVSADVQGWTEANPQGYDADAQYQMPGVAGNTPLPGSGQYQTDGQNSSGHVMYGGYLRGSRPSTSQHPSFSGPGT